MLGRRHAGSALAALLIQGLGQRGSGRYDGVHVYDCDTERLSSFPPVGVARSRAPFRTLSGKGSD